MADGSEKPSKRQNFGPTGKNLDPDWEEAPKKANTGKNPATVGLLNQRKRSFIIPTEKFPAGKKAEKVEKQEQVEKPEQVAKPDKVAKREKDEKGEKDKKANM